MDALCFTLFERIKSMQQFNFLSVGVDVSADFSWFSILTPGYAPAMKPFKANHGSLDSLEKAVLSIKKTEELHSMKARIFMESTGIYHFPLFCYLKESGFEVFVLNPLITDSNKNSGIRKVKNDRNDSLRIAKTGYSYDLKVSLIPSDLVLNIRALIREYFYLSDLKTSYVNKLHKELRTVFPGYIGIFSKIAGCASLALLKKYASPDAILAAPETEVIQLICESARRRIPYGLKKYQQVRKAAELARAFGHSMPSVFELIRMDVSFLEFLDSKLHDITDKLHSLVEENAENIFARQIALLDSISNVGFLSAAALMCEIGDFSAFARPKQLYAYFGIDPAVKQSGNFNGTKVTMSKRGSRIARKVLFSVAMASVRNGKDGLPTNAVLRSYYEAKKQSKPKMVALGAVMHKLCNIIFAVLRDGKPYVMKTPEEHAADFIAQISRTAA